MNTSFLLGVPGKLKTLVDRLTSDRAGYLDNLPTINTNAARLTSPRAGYIDYLPTINSRVTAAVATASALATVDSNVDKIVKGVAQDCKVASTDYLHTTETPILSVTGSGTLDEIRIFYNYSSSVVSGVTIKITTDNGTTTQYTIASDELIQGPEVNGSNTNIYKANFNTRFSSSLSVKMTAANSGARVRVFYSLDK